MILLWQAFPNLVEPFDNAGCMAHNGRLVLAVWGVQGGDDISLYFGNGTGMLKVGGEFHVNDIVISILSHFGSWCVGVGWSDSQGTPKED